jgi:hypothetical protein
VPRKSNHNLPTKYPLFLRPLNTSSARVQKPQSTHGQ